MAVSYGQIAVWLSSEDNPFPIWEERHISQGFAWRPTSVAFATSRDGDYDITIHFTRNTLGADSLAHRAIDVPFAIPGDIELFLGTVGDEAPFKVPPGQYALRFEDFGDVDNVGEVTLTFAAPGVLDAFRIVRADGELDPTSALLLSAEAAI